MNTISINQIKYDYGKFYVKHKSLGGSSLPPIAVSSLPEPSKDTIGQMYIAPSSTQGEENMYAEYVTVYNEGTDTYTWELLGTSIDMSDYSTTEEMNTAIASAIVGKQDVIDSSHKLNADLLLDGSTNKVYTSTEKTKLSGIETGAQVNVKPDWNAQSSSPAGILNKPDVYTKTEVDDKFVEVVIDANGHEYVEIGGLKWATMNIGASQPSDYGLYFAWGDTQGYTAEQVGSGEGQKYFGWADYKYGNGTSSPGATGMTKYNATDGLTTLEAVDDAAVANWGGSWRMPTTAEFQALGAAVNTAWTQVNNVYGILCTDKTDSSKTLFFPAAGLCDSGSVKGVGNYGRYWSSPLYTNGRQGACSLRFNSDDASWDGSSSRYYGFAVRGVLDTSTSDKYATKAEVEAKQDTISDLATIRSGAALGATAVQTETDPTVPAWAKQSSKPSYTAQEVGALPADTALFDGDYNSLTNKPTIPSVPTNVSAFNNDAGYLTQHQDISGKEDVTTIVAPVNATDATLPVTSLTCEIGKYYRLDVPVETLAVTLPAMAANVTTANTVLIYLTGGTTPAVTISAADSKDVYYQDDYEIEAGKTYEINALFNGTTWIVAAVEIVVPEIEEEGSE